jgi:hypothetical protein
MSKCNRSEADCVEFLIEEIKKSYDSVGYDKKAVGLDEVGVITPYAAQVAQIRKALGSIQGSSATQVSSVDAFQGSEKEIIILSMVRSNLRGELGFVSDWRRLNVAVTRAKRLLVVVGNMQTLSQSALWRDFFGFHKDLKVFQWNQRGLGALSPEPEKLLKTAREIAERRGVQPLPLRGDYPEDKDFAKAEKGELTWDAPAATADGGLSWDLAGADISAGDWGVALEGEEMTLKMTADGLLLDLTTTQWGMRVDGVDAKSPNALELGATISAVGGVPIGQNDNTDESLYAVEDAFGENLKDGVSVHVMLQEEILLGWMEVPGDAQKVCEELDVVSEYCAKGLLVYGPAKALDLFKSRIKKA